VGGSEKDMVVADRRQHTKLVLSTESLQAVQMTERERKTWRQRGNCHDLKHFHEGEDET
jgi:hypothetical protein